MLVFNELSATEQQVIIREVLAAYPNLTEESFNILISATKVGGCEFVGIRNYSSAESNGTELASHRINVGTSYEKMLSKEGTLLENVNVNEIDVNAFSYENIDFKGLTLEQYKQAVRDALPIALAEMQQPKAAKDTSATVKFNSMLTFNRNTHNINLYGKSENKTVSVEGTFTATKKAPKTRAKEIIRTFQDLPTDKLRYFTLQNLGSVRIHGSELIFE